MPKICNQNHDLRTRLLKRIADDKTSGASQLARTALEQLQSYIEQAAAESTPNLHREAAEMARQLQILRPSMVAIANLVEIWLENFRDLDSSEPPESLRKHAKNITHMIIQRSMEAVKQSAFHAAQGIIPGQTIMTHSYSSTVSTLFKLLKDKQITAIVTESRPGCEGKILANELVAIGITVHYVCDTQMGLFAKQADQVIVGADAVLQDGTIVNKAGTYLLALAARSEQKPFYVCCETLKHTDLSSDEIILEREAGNELSFPEREGILLENICFETTPAHLISGWIDEQGYTTNDRLE